MSLLGEPASQLCHLSQLMFEFSLVTMSQHLGDILLSSDNSRIVFITRAQFTISWH